jgi:hypothetical protein
MVRSGALTLGAIVMLGGATGARAGDVTRLFDATRSAAAFPSWGQFFQHIPENWSDLPVRVSLSEAVGRNSSLRAVPVDAVVSRAAGPIGALSLYGVDHGKLLSTMTLQTWSS